MGRANSERKKLSRSKTNKGNADALVAWRWRQKNPENLQEPDTVPETISTVQPKDNSVPSTSHENFNHKTEIFTLDKEKVDAHTLMEGNRIFNVKFLFESLAKICSHGKQFSCSFSNLTFKKEIRCGLMTKLIFQCNMCLEVFELHNYPPEDEMNLNSAAVSGIMSIGGGHSNLEEVLSCLNIPAMSNRTYQKCHSEIAEKWEQTATESMRQVALKEAEHARQIGSVDEEGYPLVPVAVDGCWSKRVYRNGIYNALSGCASIIGLHTKGVLYSAVKNKFCTFCSRRKGVENIPHICTKNHLGSSSSMESDILVEGFKKSVEMYGIKYNIMVGDGDTSTYKNVLTSRPYNNITVEKIECRNHILRNFCNKLKQLTTNTSYNRIERKLLDKNILRMRRAVRGAINYRKIETDKNKATISLRNDILNIPQHSFGNHSKCASYFVCSEAENTINLISEEFLNKINVIIYSVANHARSLLYDVDSNIVEQFHSVVAKFVGGKRVNYSLSDSYKARCTAAIVAHNTKMAHSTLRHSFKNHSNKIINRMEFRRKQKIHRQRLLKKVNKIKYCEKGNTNRLNDPDYGENCQKPDMSPEIYNLMAEDFLRKLEKTNLEIHNLERATIHQSNSGTWLEIRRKLLTASNFSKVCKRRKNSNSAKLVKNLLYGTQNLTAKSIIHGKNYEDIARKELEILKNVKVEPCGLFIDTDICYLGATPDGLLGSDTIIEIKCPYAAFNLGLSPEEAIEKKKLLFGRKQIWNFQNKPKT